VGESGIGRVGTRHDRGAYLISILCCEIPAQAELERGIFPVIEQCFAIARPRLLRFSMLLLADSQRFPDGRTV
jgi:hypothetical protein